MLIDFDLILSGRQEVIIRGCFISSGPAYEKSHRFDETVASNFIFLISS